MELDCTKDVEADTFCKRQLVLQHLKTNNKIISTMRIYHPHLRQQIDRPDYPAVTLFTGESKHRMDFMVDRNKYV